MSPYQSNPTLYNACQSEQIELQPCLASKQNLLIDHEIDHSYNIQSFNKMAAENNEGVEVMVAIEGDNSCTNSKNLPDISPQPTHSYISPFKNNKETSETSHIIQNDYKMINYKIGNTVATSESSENLLLTINDSNNSIDENNILKNFTQEESCVSFNKDNLQVNVRVGANTMSQPRKVESVILKDKKSENETML